MGHCIDFWRVRSGATLILNGCHRNSISLHSCLNVIFIFIWFLNRLVADGFFPLPCWPKLLKQKLCGICLFLLHTVSVALVTSWAMLGMCCFNCVPIRCMTCVSFLFHSFHPNLCFHFKSAVNINLPKDYTSPLSSFSYVIFAYFRMKQKWSPASAAGAPPPPPHRESERVGTSWGASSFFRAGVSECARWVATCGQIQPSASANIRFTPAGSTSIRLARTAGATGAALIHFFFFCFFF